MLLWVCIHHVWRRNLVHLKFLIHFMTIFIFSGFSKDVTNLAWPLWTMRKCKKSLYCLKWILSLFFKCYIWKLIIVRETIKLENDGLYSNYVNPWAEYCAQEEENRKPPPQQNRGSMLANCQVRSKPNHSGWRRPSFCARNEKHNIRPVGVEALSTSKILKLEPENQSQLVRWC